jgi:hypothetical protein
MPVLKLPEELFVLLMRVWSIVVISMFLAVEVLSMVTIVESVDLLKGIFEPFSRFIHGSIKSFSFGTEECFKICI